MAASITTASLGLHVSDSLHVFTGYKPSHMLVGLHSQNYSDFTRKMAHNAYVYSVKTIPNSISED